MRRNGNSLFDDIVDIASFLPSWLSALLAILSYFILHHYSDLTPPDVSNHQELFQFANKQIFKTFAYFLQFILPLAFILGIFISLHQRAKWHGLPSALKSLTFTLTVSCLTLALAVLYWYPVQPIRSYNSESIKKHSNVSPATNVNSLKTGRQNPSIIKLENSEYSEQEIEFAKSNVLHDRKNDAIYEIQLKSGRSIFAQHVTVEGNTIAIDNETGLRVTLDKRNVMRINKISESGN